MTSRGTTASTCTAPSTSRLPTLSAEQQVARCFAIVTPPHCNTYVDRAILRATRGDHAGAKPDLDVILARTCRDPEGLNILYLIDLALLLAVEHSRDAEAIFGVADAACHGAEWCQRRLGEARAEATKAQEEAKKRKPPPASRANPQPAMGDQPKQ